MGGVARRATALNDLKKAHPLFPVLVVDAGNVLKQSEDIENPLNRWIVEALNELGTHAVNATLSDLKRLNKLAELGRIPRNNSTAYVASMIQASGQDLFPPKPFVVQTLRADPGSEEIRVGILAVSPASGDAAIGDRTIAADAAIRRYLPEVDSQSDLVVLLTRMPAAELAGIARMFPGIDVIINGNPTGEGREFPMVGSTVIVESAHAGVAVGVLQLEWDSKGHIQKSQNQLIPLPPLTREAPKLAQIVESAHREAAAFEEAEAQKSPPVTIPSVFAGPNACKNCHEKAFKVWQQSAHAHAVETLKRDLNQYNRDCVMCHVTGFDMDRGFVNVLRSPQLASVQCEACHGISADHVRDPMAKHPGIGVFQLNRFKVKPSSCKRCHDEDRSPKFDFDKYWKKIEH
jgi:hypothetical protein